MIRALLFVLVMVFVIADPSMGQIQWGEGIEGTLKPSPYIIEYTDKGKTVRVFEVDLKSGSFSGNMVTKVNGTGSITNEKGEFIAKGNLAIVEGWIALRALKGSIFKLFRQLDTDPKPTERWYGEPSKQLSLVVLNTDNKWEIKDEHFFFLVNSSYGLKPDFASSFARATNFLVPEKLELSILGNKILVGEGGGIIRAVRGQIIEGNNIKVRQTDGKERVFAWGENTHLAKDINQLVSLAESEDLPTMTKAAFSIANSHSPFAVGPLLDLVKSKYAFRSLIGALSLTYLNRKEVIDPIIDLLESDKWWHRQKGAWIFGRLENKNKKVVERLIELLDDESWEVRMYAAWALGRLEAKKALPALKNLAINQKGMKDGAEAANAAEVIAKGRYYVKIDSQPPWLLVPDQDVPVRAIYQGVIVTLKSVEKHQDRWDYTFEASDNKMPLKILNWNGIIIYWGGKGIIKDKWIEQRVQLTNEYNKWLEKI